MAAELATLSQSSGLLDTRSPRRTSELYAVSPARVKFRKELIERYLQIGDAPSCDGRSAVLTAGPPGAGKSTLLALFADELEGFRQLDADVVKDFLIEHALEDGIYDDILSTILPDGATLAPREIASLVHEESTRLIDQIRELCVERRENVIIEGTLSWPGHGRRSTSIGEKSTARNATACGP